MVRSCNRIDQLFCDANFPRSLAHSLFNDIAHARFLPDHASRTLPAMLLGVVPPNTEAEYCCKGVRDRLLSFQSE